jgi:hypothetical protein
MMRFFSLLVAGGFFFLPAPYRKWEEQLLNGEGREIVGRADAAEGPDNAD